MQIARKYEIREKLQELLNDENSAEDHPPSILFSKTPHGNDEVEEEESARVEVSAESGDFGLTTPADASQINAALVDKGYEEKR